MPRPHNVESVFNHKFLCMYDMKMTGTKKMKIEPRPLMEEIMFMEILVRLPVKSLARFQSVCKAWRAIINDPKFIRAHLRHSASKCEQDPCLLIIPHTLDSVIPDEGWPTTFSNHFSFYQWQLQPTPNNSKNNNVATFLDAKSFSHQFRSLRYVTHCDGLVFAPTNTSLYLFNPATRDAITLPDSPRNNLRAGGRTRCYCAGLGLDPRTGKYKVVQAFYRSLDPVTRKGTNMGMEVFTVAGDGRWREISSDPPYPAKKFQTAVAVSGFMFWRLADRHMECEVSGILYLSLEEEEFGIAGLPYALGPDDEFMLDVLRHGRDLCLTASDSERRILSIWTVPIADEGLNTMWEWRYSILFPGLCHTLAIPPPGDDDDTGIILWQGKTIYGYDFDNWERKILCDLRRLRYQRARKLKNAFVFSVKPFTESLVRVQLRANEIKKAQISSWALL